MADMITVRFFAGSRAAAGRPEAHVPAGCTLEELVAALSARYGSRLADVLAVSSFLVDGATCHDRARPLPATTVDVLPPFAGG